MRQPLNTNKLHEPHWLYLDEGLSGPALAGQLRRAKIPVLEYQECLTKNNKTPDGDVIKLSSELLYVLVTKDGSMEWDDGLQDIIKYRAKVIIITDQHGGPANWAAALICSEKKWRRTLLDNPIGPLIISINPEGGIKKIVGEEELLQRREVLLTKKYSRAKRHKNIQPVTKTETT